MAINPALLVSAAMMQDYFVDNATGLAMSDGVITMYQDDSRTTLKNWYYQTGIPGNYTYLPLDNPLTLSAVGTISDPSGNDTIPFYYPYSEIDSSVVQAYYVTVVDSNGQAQFTRQNFPGSNLGSGGGGVTGTNTEENYIINNVYWRNIGSATLTNTQNQIVAPSQHDGYLNNAGTQDGNSDIRFLKNINGAVDNISFIPMTQTLQMDITPETQLSMTCSTPLSAGETEKCIQYPVSLHLATLSNGINATTPVVATIVFHAQNITGNANGILEIYLYQFYGTGAPTQPFPVLLYTANLTNTYQRFAFTFPLPAAPASTSLGGGGDDALFVQVGYPLNKSFGINHTKPQFYLSTTPPTNNFATYDQIEAIINSPRTGDLRASLNPFAPFGWVGMDNGSIGSPTSNASMPDQNTWPLYWLLWNGVGVSWAPMVDGLAYGINAITDWNAGRGIRLTDMLSNVITGANVGAGEVSGSFLTAAVQTGSPIVLTFAFYNMFMKV